MADGAGEPDNVTSVASAVVIGPANHSLDYIECAAEAGTCVLGGSKYVAFGANGSFVFRALSGNVACSVSTFGVDPALNVGKRCYMANYAFRVSENVSDRVGVGTRDIAYGANGAFNFRSVGASYTCNNATFGDPAPGQAKACYSALLGYFPVVGEGGALSHMNNTAVAYGANGRFIFRVLTGSIACTNAAFGSDPAPGVAKTCYQLGLPFLADEASTYNLGAPGSVLYGSGLNGNFLSGSQTSAVCGNGTFGGDPAFGVGKHCWGSAFVP